MNEPFTQRQCLNGLWQFHPVTDVPSGERPPATWSDTPIQVPSYWNVFPASCGGDWEAYDNFGYPREWHKAHSAWYRCTFRANSSRCFENGRVRLTFDAVAGAARVILNGRLLGENHDLFLPFTFDVTDVIRAGTENELLVHVGAPQQADGLWLQPPGSWVGWHLRGIWQDVRLDYVPGRFIEDVFVQTSVERMEIAADVTIRNATNRPFRGAVSAKVNDDGRGVLEIDPREVEVGPGARTVVRLTKQRPEAVLWCPDRPRLYTLDTHLGDHGRSTLHQERTRFGFRQFEVRGTDFVLNGEKVRLFGDSWHYMGAAQQNIDYARTWFKLVKETGGNSVRLHAMPHPPCYLDAADEMGILIIDETGVYGSAASLGLADERFWGRARDHMRRLVLRDRNHPSVVLWSASNEVVWKGGADAFPHLLSLEAEARRLDPTRPVSFDENDSDLGGGASIHGGHYGTPKHWDAVWHRTKPLMVNEFCSLYHGGPNECSPYVGDAGYADFHQRWAGAGEEAVEMFWSLRELGAASITPWNVNWYSMTPMPDEAITPTVEDVSGPGVKVRRIGAHSLTLNYGYAKDAPVWRPNPAYEPIREAYTPQAFRLERRPRQWFGGRHVELRATIFNDTRKAASLELRWSLVLDGRERESGSVSAKSEGYANVARSLQLTMPAVDTVTKGQLTLSLFAPDRAEPVYAQSHDVHVWPLVRVNDVRRPCVAIAGGGTDGQQMLSDWGCETAPVTGPDDALPSEAMTLVLAAGGPEATLSSWIDSASVRGLLDRGGTVLVLPGGTSPDAALAPAPLERSYGRAFVRMGEHPWLAGLTDEDFRDWPPDGVVARQVYVRPSDCEARPLLDVGDASDGMPYTPLLLVPHGTGRVCFCGLDLLAHARDVPVAAELLARIIARDSDPASRTAVHVAQGEDNALCTLLNEVGAECAFEPPAPESQEVWLIEAAQLRQQLDQKRNLLAFVNNGGTLVLTGLTPETAGLAQSLLGVDIEVREDKCYNVALSDDSPLLTGVNNYDLCWVERGEKCPIANCTLAIDAPSSRTLVQTVATRWEDYQMTAEQHKGALMVRRLEAFEGSRAVVVEIPLGRGRVVLNQLRIAEAEGPFRERAQRIVSQLLTNLGAARCRESIRRLEVAEQFVDRQGYIKRWLVLGAFESPGANPIDEPFIDEVDLTPPAPGRATAGKTWQEASSAWPQVDLRPVLGDEARDHCAAYAAVYVYTPTDRSVILDSPNMVSLLIGSDDAAKVWVNGRQLGRFDYVRPLVLDQNRMDSVPLTQGWNLLLIKIAESTGDWQFAARFVSPSGEPVSDLQYALARPEA